MKNIRLPSPDQVAKFGHIAGLIRERLKALNWNNQQFAEAVTGDPKSTIVYGWLGARNAPGHKLAPKIAAVLGVKVTDLRPKLHSRAVSVVKAPLLGPVSTPFTAKDSSPVLTFRANADGTARIQLDVVLPVAHAMPLLRTLLDAGVVPQPETANG